MRDELKPINKKPYVTPTVTVHGDVEAITLGFNVGERLDQTFPLGTPLRDVTLS